MKAVNFIVKFIIHKKIEANCTRKGYLYTEGLKVHESLIVYEKVKCTLKSYL